MKVHDPNRVGYLLEVMALSAAEDQIDVISVTGDPSREADRPAGSPTSDRS